MRSVTGSGNTWYVIWHRNGKEIIVGKYPSKELACAAAWPKY